MRQYLKHLALAATLVTPVATAGAQLLDPAAAMHWRMIGPTRAGRGRSAVGVAGQPNVFYVGYDNGGVWRTTDFGANWFPLFDDQPTGSIGAIAVAPSDPNTIYVGSGAGIIRPDLATGDGMYKSTDAGRTWTHLGLRESQMIAWIEVDPKDANRLFVAVLGHPYGPNSERGVFRSTDGGTTFTKVLYKDEYTSANDVRMDPNNPNVLYAALWQQQQSFIEGQGFGGTSGGIFKSTDGGANWRPLTNGLPGVIQANLAISPSNPQVLYASVAGATANNVVTGAVNLYRSNDGGEHWFLALNGPDAPPGATPRVVDNRPLGRIGGGDLPTITIDPKNENVVYSVSTVMWRTEDGGVTWTAVRGAPGGDDYQRAWINPNDPNLILVIADQGAVISGNRGQSWSNWYTQPTAAMYHVTTDMSFPYKVCGGQQDSGSACVDSRSMDGMITFRDWAPVNIQEYGIAAPDPKDPDMVFGSARNNVSLFNRRTRQTTNVGPDMTGFNRNVRTMPIHWSPVDNNTLFYASNAVWKSTDRAHSWTRISPDLARQAWAVPSTAGKYATGVTPAPAGTITALSPSPKDIKVMWTGTDDGFIQTTADGGRTWANVTPPVIKPWTRIFNIDAGHFDTKTAYAAANTMRLDDFNPHFFRTHDGGKTWTEINTGIAGGSVANSIREDPRVKGLLYAGTDTQVWVSFDDGDHWQPLRLNMPAISVRDLTIKDDDSCLCADLVAGTHGRGFWVLDDLSPLRQAAMLNSAKETRASYLVKPHTAVRVRFATNEPTPWPPEMTAGENPPNGGVIDYYVGATASKVALDILDGTGKLVRHYTSDEPAPRIDPGLNPDAYNREICQKAPTAPHCAFPLYWAAPTQILSPQAGMHRFTWDLRFQPLAPEGTPPGEAAQGAVPHRTYDAASTPWAPAGNYTVKLTVDGKSYTQPLTLKLDPRVKTPAAGLAQLASLSRELYEGALSARDAYAAARAAADASSDAGLKARIDSIAPAPVRGGRGGRGGGGGGGFGAAPAGPPTLESAGNALLAAAMSMQGADVAPTARQVTAAKAAQARFKEAMAKWTSVRPK
ncbi:MAG: glycoside hydrolase [Gemmatimonadaceae bacterium]